MPFRAQQSLVAVKTDVEIADQMTLKTIAARRLRPLTSSATSKTKNTDAATMSVRLAPKPSRICSPIKPYWCATGG
ncbi:MAG: hypothetical protein ACYCSN_13640 [Acidobacteriaceae bacterium]